MNLSFEAHTHWHELPMVECPHCGKEFQWDDYYDVKTGSETECSKCEKTIYVAESYVSMNVRLSRENELD